MNSNVLLSIIIPIYNTEKYIRTTLESIAKQSRHNFEIILINDGTKDKAIDVAKKYLEEKNLEYKLINQDNKGQSVARNEGIKSAVGKYLLFLDSDDYIESNLTEIIEENLEDDLEMLLYDYKRVRSNGEILENTKQKFDKFNTVVDGLTVFNSYKDNMLRIWTSSVIYNREFIEKNNITFLEGSYAAEDLNFLFKSLLKAKKIKCIEESLAYYYQRKDSLTNNPDINKNITVIKSMEDVCKFIKENNIDEELIDAIKKEFIPEHIMYQVLGSLNSNNAKEVREVLKKENVKEYLKMAKKETPRYGSSVYMWIKMASVSTRVFIQVFLKKTGR